MRVSLCAAILLVVISGLLLIRHSRRRLQAELTARSAFTLLRSTMDNVTQGIAVFDARRRLVAWNARFLELRGLTHAQVELHMPIHEILRIGATLEMQTEAGARSTASVPRRAVEREPAFRQRAQTYRRRDPAGARPADGRRPLHPDVHGRDPAQAIGSRVSRPGHAAVVDPRQRRRCDHHDQRERQRRVVEQGSAATVRLHGSRDPAAQRPHSHARAAFLGPRRLHPALHPDGRAAHHGPASRSRGQAQGRHADPGRSRHQRDVDRPSAGCSSASCATSPRGWKSSA